MTEQPAARRSSRARAARLLLGTVPRAVTAVRRNPPPENVTLLGLLLASGSLLLMGLVYSESVFPPVSQVLPLLLGGLLLRRGAMRRLMVAVALCLACDVAVLGLFATRPGSIVTVAVTGLVGHEFARSREETGLGGLRGDVVLVELRRRLELQGALPELLGPYHGETVLLPAGGAPFAGDFVVSARSSEGRVLSVALVDVSGKGVEAGTRSLLLSGALGGLLGALPVDAFLPAANAYLFAQDWEEGFATAAHLSLDLETGYYAIESAGHPPAAHFDAGSGRWQLLESPGPALGLVPEARYEPDCGVLRPGDALLLYTDGLVEIPGRDLSVGIDKLLGAAEHLITGGFHGGAQRLVDRVAAHSSDDRGLVLIWRDR